MQLVEFVVEESARQDNVSQRQNWRNPHLYKLYGYGLCMGKPTPKIAENKVQDSSILGTWNFWWQKGGEMGSSSYSMVVSGSPKRW